MKALWGVMDGVRFQVDYVDRKYLIFVEGKQVGLNELKAMNTKLSMLLMERL